MYVCALVSKYRRRVPSRRTGARGSVRGRNFRTTVICGPYCSIVESAINPIAGFIHRAKGFLIIYCGLFPIRRDCATLRKDSVPNRGQSWQCDLCRQGCGSANQKPSSERFFLFEHSLAHSQSDLAVNVRKRYKLAIGPRSRNPLGNNAPVCLQREY